MARVLLATLGPSPGVVTGALKAVEAQTGRVDRADMVYPTGEEPSDPDWPRVEYGAAIIQQHLAGHCETQSCRVDIPDTNSRERTITFLRTIANVLETSQASGDEVHLLVAGGRKNMSALAAIVAGFFPCVQAVYHLLDRRVVGRGDDAFPSIVELDRLTPEERRKALEPDLEYLNLFAIPFPRIAEAPTLRQWLKHADGPVKNGLRPLKGACERRDVTLIERPVTGIADVDSTERCETFLKALSEAIGDERDRAPDVDLALLLSGGRKAMAACALTAAQRFGIPSVYHTTIRNTEDERRIMDLTSIDALQKLRPDEVASRLFPSGKELDAFDLFAVPGIHLA